VFGTVPSDAVVPTQIHRRSSPAASEGIALHPLAVQAGFRREVPSIYVADGVEVVEIDLPVQSPLPVVQSLKDRLMADDVDGALELIHPLQRRLFAQIYSDLGPNLQLDAAAMGSLSIDLLGEDRAIVRIEAWSRLQPARSSGASRSP
jgi:hypothetical protein